MTVYNPKEVEKQVQELWAKKKVAERIVKLDPNRKKFYLLDGPPYVNYIPHVGHIKTTTFKDVWGKFRYMQGYAVWFQPGFDCSGLPIENAVEKKLGIKSKKDIEEKIGIKKFIQACKEHAEENRPVWMDLYKKIASWRGWLEPYMTYKNYYLESGWWTLKKLYEKGLLVEGYRPGFWCPHCETVLSGYEVTDSYKNLEDPSIFIKFPVKSRQKEFLLVWTTTPWTLPGNVAVVVHPKEIYVRVKVGGDVLILAKKRLDELSNMEIGYNVLEEFEGKKLDGMRYENILDLPVQKELQKNPKAHRVYMSIPVMKRRVVSKTATKKEVVNEEEFGHMVTMDTGSGIVHTAPGHGDVDNKIGKRYGMPEISPVDEQGKLTKEAGEFEGKFVKDADHLIIERLKKNGYLLYASKITHSYPLCWRCKNPLIYRMSKQWFLSVDSVRNKMIERNKKVRWLPDFARERFHNVLIDAPDWAITRQRYWGIPLPIWACGKCGEKKVIGSRKELVESSVKKISEDIDLHKDSVDSIRLRCKCGGEMKRLNDIMDVWFDSGISPWASLGYPFMNKDLLEKLWPVDLIDESQDQVRGWFYTLMVCGITVFGSEPYKTVCLNGWTLDEKGEKMSKSLGNVVLAEDAYKELGADLLRLYYCYDNAPWETQKFSVANAKELMKSLNVLWNSYLFAKTYSGSEKSTAPENLKKEDEWILSRINSLTGNVTSNLETFSFHLASRELVDFILNDFSRWYIKIIRDRVSPWYDGEDKQAATYALSYVLERLVKLLAPITPFISEMIYQDMLGGDSVHLSPWPKPDRTANKRLEQDMEIIKSLVENMNSLRQEEKVKLRWPVDKIFVQAKDSTVERAVKNLEDVIKEMGNVKEVVISKKISGKIKEFDGNKITLGNVLMDEALIRELTRQIQELRKKSGLHVNNVIELWFKSDKESEGILNKNSDYLKKEVGAKRLNIGVLKNKKGLLDFEGKNIEIGFERVG